MTVTHINSEGDIEVSDTMRGGLIIPFQRIRASLNPGDERNLVLEGTTIATFGMDTKDELLYLQGKDKEGTEFNISVNNSNVLTASCNTKAMQLSPIPENDIARDAAIQRKTFAFATWVMHTIQASLEQRSAATISNTRAPGTPGAGNSGALDEEAKNILVQLQKLHDRYSAIHESQLEDDTATGSMKLKANIKEEDIKRYRPKKAQAVQEAIYNINKHGTIQHNSVALAMVLMKEAISEKVSDESGSKPGNFFMKSDRGLLEKRVEWHFSPGLSALDKQGRNLILDTIKMLCEKFDNALNAIKDKISGAQVVAPTSSDNTGSSADAQTPGPRGPGSSARN